jgi:hypothetical protein
MIGHACRSQKRRNLEQLDLKGLKAQKHRSTPLYVHALRNWVSAHAGNRSGKIRNIGSVGTTYQNV